jgi:hypothetical protein
MSATMTEQRIEIAYPDGAEPSLLLRAGPCRVTLAPFDGPGWISGVYSDPGGALPLQIVTGALTVLSQRFDPVVFSGAALPHLDLRISRERPFAFEIQVGASENHFDLGGLPISRLALKAGAGRFDIDFATPNPTALSLIDLSAGAGSISARHLANANFALLRFGGGVAACTLDFSGALTRDAAARIDSGLGSIDITVPALTAARVSTKTFATARRATGGFIAQGDVYSTAPALQGARPLLDIDVSLAFGSLSLTTI